MTLNCRTLFAVVAVAGLLWPGVRRAHAQENQRVVRPEFWKGQGLEVLSAWTQHAPDEEYGAFHSHLNRRWEPFNGTDKYPGMVARHVFSYSAAYLLSGTPEHLTRAREAVDFMVEHGWDEEYGGWYNAVSRSGAVTDSTKDLFMQLYAATGLTLYYTATRSDRALRYVTRTNELLETHAWDETHGGYIRTLGRDLSVEASHKDFTPQGAALSGYLLYLYHATRDDAYLDQMQRILDVMMGPMRAPGPPWIYERFAADWTFQSQDSKNETINVGHNLELAWLVLRMQDLVDAKQYRPDALRLADRLRERTLTASGAWTTSLRRPELTTHPDQSSWWMQAYGNMSMLTLYQATAQPSALDDFRRGARFWNRAFIDSTYGGTVLKTTLDGTVLRGTKAVRSKTSYHALEHALLNYLYLGLWVADEPVTLHFRVDRPEAGETLYPLPIAADATIQSVEINGEPWTQFDAAAPSVTLPERDTRLRVTVTMK